MLAHRGDPELVATGARPPTAGAQRDPGAHPERAARRAARRRRAQQPVDRAAAVRDRQHGREPSAPRLHEARHSRPRAAAARARRHLAQAAQRPLRQTSRREMATSARQGAQAVKPLITLHGDAAVSGSRIVVRGTRWHVCPVSLSIGAEPVAPSRVLLGVPQPGQVKPDAHERFVLTVIVPEGIGAGDHAVQAMAIGRSGEARASATLRVACRDQFAGHQLSVPRLTPDYVDFRACSHRPHEEDSYDKF